MLLASPTSTAASSSMRPTLQTATSSSCRAPGLHLASGVRAAAGAAAAGVTRAAGLAAPGLRSRASSVTRTQASSSSSTGSSSGDSNPWAQPGYLDAVVSRMPESQQTAVFVGILLAIGAGTAVNSAVLGPAVSSVLPDFLQVHRDSWFPLGPIFMAAGVAHFTEEQGFKNMFPHQGAWGLWYLPGSPQLHVYWTGVVEIAGGLGLCLGALPFDAIPSWLSPASALGLFLLTAVVTPANIYMYTHNAPGPIPETVSPGALPWQGHLARGLMQVLLLSTLWGIATASS